jgi:hypothetical protein
LSRWSGCSRRQGQRRETQREEEEIDAWLENKRAARDEAIGRHETIGRVPS